MLLLGIARGSLAHPIWLGLTPLSLGSFKSKSVEDKSTFSIISLILIKRRIGKLHLILGGGEVDEKVPSNWLRFSHNTQYSRPPPFIVSTASVLVWSYPRRMIPHRSHPCTHVFTPGFVSGNAFWRSLIRVGEVGGIWKL